MVYHYSDLPTFAVELRGSDQELALPVDAHVRDGEWVLAIFEIGIPKGRATAAAARGFDRGDEGLALVFERRDWERLIDFAETTSVSAFPAARPLSTPPPRVPASLSGLPATIPPPSVREAAPTLRDRRSTIPPQNASDSIPPSDSLLTPSVRTLKVAASAHVGARLLIVDDDADVRELVGTMLTTIGLEVERVESAEDALAKLAVELFDLVLVDWTLPGMPGIDLCRTIRSTPEFAHLPVVFLTSHSSSKDLVDAFAAGADDYVVKPFRAPELGARIFGLLRRTRLLAGNDDE